MVSALSSYECVKGVSNLHLNRSIVITSMPVCSIGCNVYTDSNTRLM